MNITTQEKAKLVESEYGDLYEGIRSEVAAGNYPHVWGLSSERAKEWGYDMPKTLESLLSILYDELATLGRFGEEARQENYIFQHIQDGSYSLLKENKNTLRRFVSTYAVLIWGVLVSSKNEHQKNVIRGLFLLYGTRSEKIASLVGVNRLPIHIINLVEDIETTKLIITTIPALLTHIPITESNYIKELPKLRRWDAMCLVASGQFLSDNPSLKNGLLTRIHNSLMESIPRDRGTYHRAISTLIGIVRCLAYTGILRPNTEDHDVLNGLIAQNTSILILNKTVNWQDYNTEQNPDKLLVMEVHKFNYLFEQQPNINYTRVFTGKSIRNIYGVMELCLAIIKLRYFEPTGLIDYIIHYNFQMSTVKHILQNEEILRILQTNPITSTRFWPLIIVNSSVLAAKAILNTVTMTLTDYINAIRDNYSITLERMRNNADVISNLKDYIDKRINIDSMYLILKTLDSNESSVQNDVLLNVIIPFIAVDNKSIFMKAKKVLRLVINKKLYITELFAQKCITTIAACDAYYKENKK